MIETLRRIPLYFFSALVVIAVLLLTCLPAPEFVEKVPAFPGADKLVHAIMFGGVVGAFVFDVLRRDAEALNHKKMVAFLAFALALGALTEFVQSLEAVKRSGDVYDFIADAIGAYVAYLIAPGICRKVLRIK